MFALFAILAVMASCGNEKTTEEVEVTEVEVVEPSQESDVAPVQESDVAAEGADAEATQEVVEPAVK